MRHSAISIQDKFSISLNSLGFFLLSYLFVYLLHQSVTCFAASLFNVRTLLRFNDLLFFTDDSGWNFSSVKTIFLAGPIITFFCGIVFLMIAYRIHEYDGLLRLFFLWGALHASNFFFGAMIVGVITGSGIGYALNWMFLMDTGKLIVVLLAAVSLINTGIIITRMFLFTVNSYFPELRKDRKCEYLRVQLLYPFLFGSLILYFVKSPVNTTDLLLPGTLLLSIIPMFIRQSHFPDLNFEDGKPHSVQISPSLIICASLALLLFRTALAK